MKIASSILLFVSLLVFSCSKKPEKQNNNDQALSTNTIDSLQISTNLYVIQVAAFKNSTNAEKMVALLRESNFPVFVVDNSQADNDSLYRVRVGPFANQSVASANLQKLVELGHSGAYLVRNQPPDDLTSLDDSIKSQIDSTKIFEFKPQSDLRQLTRDLPVSNPEWSPQGREIAYYNKQLKGIFAIGTAGGQTSQIIATSPRRTITPKYAWSMQSDKIAFVALEEERSGRKVESLYVINKDGSDMNRILSQENFSFEMNDLTWKPDGKAIAFNAKYGGVDAHSDIAQVVMIADLNKQIKKFSDLRGTQRSVGWQTENNFLFLNTYNGMNHSHQYGYELWNFDVVKNSIKRVLTGAVVRNCQEIYYLTEQNSIVYSAFEPQDRDGFVVHETVKIVKLDLGSGSQSVLFESHSGHLEPGLLVANTGDIFFTYKGRLWHNDLKGNNVPTSQVISTNNATLAPWGNKICFEENSNLFITKFQNMAPE